MRLGYTMVYSISEKESDHLRQTHKSKPGKDIKYSDRGEENWEGWHHLWGKRIIDPEELSLAI